MSKIYKVLSFEDECEITIVGYCDKNEIYDIINMVKDMEAFLDFDLIDIFISKLFSEEFKFKIIISLCLSQKDLAINLLESKGFKSFKKNISTPIIKSEAESKVIKEKITYDEEYHLHNKSQLIKNLYYSLKDRILMEYSGVEVIPKKTIIIFKKGKKSLISCNILTERIIIIYNMKKGTLNDPLTLTRDISSIGHWGSGDYDFSFREQLDMDYAMFLFKQTYLEITKNYRG